MRYLRSITWALLSLVLFGPLLAAVEYDVCTELVKTALEATDDVCVNTGRNSACYGHVQLEAEPQAGFESFKFDEVGDTVSVAQLNTLRLSPMDLQAGTWGVALLRLQADIPDDKPQNVNLLLFGDVVVENLAPAPILMDVIMNSTGNANIRRKPESSAFVMGTLPRGQTVTARGRSEDNQWIYIELPESDNQRGWVLRSLVRSEEDLDSLNIVQPNMTQYGPMQAFYLKTGAKQSTCAEAPNDGLLVQTPEGVAEVRLWINEVKIRLGSTAFIQSSPGNQMTIKTLEGSARVEALGVEQAGVWGVVAGVLHFIPYLGPVVFALASGVAAFMQFGNVLDALAVAGASLVVATIVGSLILTWVQGRYARVNAAVLFIALLFFGWLWGVWGLLLGAPLVAIAKVVCDRVESLQPVGELLGH